MTFWYLKVGILGSILKLTFNMGARHFQEIIFYWKMISILLSIIFHSRIVEVWFWQWSHIRCLFFSWVRALVWAWSKEETGLSLCCHKVIKTKFVKHKMAFKFLWQNQNNWDLWFLFSILVILHRMKLFFVVFC